MIALLDILVTWWPVFALLQVPDLAQALAVVLAKRTKSALDHRIPDDLPMTAGDWLAGRLDALGHPISAIVTDRRPDAYRPDDRLIQLSEETHFKADPAYWATAAHELGHARSRAELPIVGYLRSAATWGSFVLVPAGVGLAFGRVLYALPAAGVLAFRCFAIAAGLQLFVLVDEAHASVIAYRELHANDAIDFVHLRAIRRVLITAFATYLVTYAAYALLLRYWPLVESLAGERPVRPGGLTGLGSAVAIVASIGCVGAMLSGLVWMFAPRDLGDALEANRVARYVIAFLRTISIVVMLWLAWDRRVDAVYVWCAILAFAASSRIWLALLDLPFLLPYVVVVRWLSRFTGRGIDRTARYLRARELGAQLVWMGNQRLERLADQRNSEPAWVYRLTALARLGYLPLLVAFWLT